MWEGREEGVRQSRTREEGEGEEDGGDDNDLDDDFGDDFDEFAEEGDDFGDFDDADETPLASAPAPAPQPPPSDVLGDLVSSLSKQTTPSKSHADTSPSHP